ncbi:hypothetical protein [Prevotella sp. HUN102]|uniref:hypothetical protein n=1 Tax=Prevotella sp. HUN102 TaxID=1392486 RepID=UPI00048D5E9E|nr:hypothetical protein [Prevotella sp. HUN102]
MERELTGKETAKCMAGMVIMFLLTCIKDDDYSMVAFIRLLIAIILGVVVVAYQYRCMHSPLEKEEENGK